jgi:hypothetical protein
MNNDEKSLKKEVNRKLKTALTQVDFQKELVRVDDEDGNYYWTLRPRTKLTLNLLNTIDDVLIQCAKLYRDAGIRNKNKYYAKVARMVHYAMDELEAKQSLEHTIEEMMGEFNDN